MTYRLTALGLAAAIALPSAALAQDMTLGEFEYANSCAQCHGMSGKGDGPIAGFLNTQLPDLTTLAATNGGVFPVSRVFEIIEGSPGEGAHGTQDMPAWGTRYRYRVSGPQDFEFSPEDRERYVKLRILALVDHLLTLQAE